jgi:hypothetical protein
MAMRARPASERLNLSRLANSGAKIRLAECVVNKAYFAGLDLEIAPRAHAASARDNETLLIALEIENVRSGTFVRRGRMRRADVSVEHRDWRTSYELRRTPVERSSVVTG